MEEDGRCERLDVYAAVRSLTDLFPEVVASMRISMNRREFTPEEWVDFIGEAASEVAGCLRRKAQPELSWSGQAFPHVSKALNEAIDNEEFTWERLVLFLCGVQKILNELRSDGGEQPKQGGKIMDKKEQEEQLKVLSRAIMEAITNDAKVMTMLRDLKERGIVDDSTLLGLALRIGEIVEISGMALRQEELGEQNVPQLAEPAKPEASAVVPPAHELIDGRELSAKEVEFQAWSAERFDERAWLKSMGLIF